MTSILTNTSAMSALSTLRLIGGRLDDESQKLCSGLGVKTAADNAAYWSISTTMRSDVKAMGAVTDSIGLAMGIVDTAYAAMETVRQSFVEIRNLAITASDMPKPGMRDIVKPAFSLDPEYAKSDVYKIDVRIQQLQDQARSAMQSASFAGVNMLYHEKHEPVKASKQVFSFVIGYNGGTVQAMDVSAMDTLLLNDDFGSYPTSYPGEYNPEKTLFDGSDFFDVPGTFTPAAIYWYNIPLSNPVTGDPEAYPVSPTYISHREPRYQARFGQAGGLQPAGREHRREDRATHVQDGLCRLGAVGTNTYDELNKKVIETATKGIGRLVDADMDVTAVRIRALEAQQQLAIQALGIANSEPGKILELFR